MWYLTPTVTMLLGWHLYRKLSRLSAKCQVWYITLMSGVVYDTDSDNGFAQVTLLG